MNLSLAEEVMGFAESEVPDLPFSLVRGVRGVSPARFGQLETRSAPGPARAGPAIALCFWCVNILLAAHVVYASRSRRGSLSRQRFAMVDYDKPQPKNAY